MMTGIADKRSMKYANSLLTEMFPNRTPIWVSLVDRQDKNCDIMEGVKLHLRNS